MEAGCVCGLGDRFSGSLVLLAIMISHHNANSARSDARFKISYLLLALKLYRTEYQQFLTGPPVKILRALDGNNPKRIVFLVLIA